MSQSKLKPTLYDMKRQLENYKKYIKACQKILYFLYQQKAKFF